ncbi:hypothetical protein C8Q77DRAFT_1050282 [Trametes polyzona]|nr:hypothetical protein C8Q77DRAFT_1050282 [Trametes polyzona]
MPQELPSIGARLSHSGYLGTVRFVGPVDGTQGVWLGVEWDDPKRGKHDGIKDGKRYFTCLVPNSGSFIRPSPNISYGVSFLAALSAKYIEVPHGGEASEKVILGSSGGAIEVEAVGLDKIRSKLAHLERLREVSLDNENVSKADPPGEIRRTCPGVRGLDLSKNLIPGWDVVAAIAVELPDLRRLSLRRNRLQLSQRLDASAFHRLEELLLNATLTSWDEFQAILPCMPALKSVELGYNRLRLLRGAHERKSGPEDENVTLQSVNFDGNELESFADICTATNNLTVLQRLVLTSNAIAQIPLPSVNRDGEIATTSGVDVGGPGVRRSLFPELRHLALAFNRIASWSDIDALPHWCPQLESLTLAGNPILDDPVHKTHVRPFAIAKIPSLKILDGAAVSAKERTDSELLYLSYISKLGLSDAEKRAQHPQWDALSSKHGFTDAPTPSAPQEAQDTLSNRLISVRIYASVGGPPPHSLPADEVEGYLGACRAAETLRVLSTMSVRTFRLKVLKAFKVPKAQQNVARLWMVMPDGHFVALDEEYAGRDLSWWGVEDGATFVLAENTS